MSAKVSDLGLPLHSDIDIIFSDVNDGSMAAGGGAPSTSTHMKNADRFLSRHGFSNKRSRVLVEYTPERTYTDVRQLSDETIGQEVACDALYTTEPGRVITLPVADCVATVVYDPVTGMLGVLHLGRHSSVAGLIEAFIIEVADSLGSDPRDWLVWMSPSLKMVHDRLEFFEPIDSDEWSDFARRGKDGIYIDMVGHNQARFIRAGVELSNIVSSKSDTYSDDNYFSHRAYLDSRSDKNGRMMVAAKIIND